MIKFLDLQAQYRRIAGEIDEAIAEVLAEARFIGGPAVETFERQFAGFLGASHCVAVANGTDAIEIAFEAMQLSPRSEVIVPANSFIASSEAVSRAGHIVVFCDVGDDYCIDPQDLERRITGRTAAVVVVHLYGRPAEMDGILQIARRSGLRVLEDCAQAHGAKYHGTPVGTLGNIATFSFFPGKNLGAYGDGGAIVTNNAALASRCRMIGNHGRIAKYDHVLEGRNSRLDAIQAAVLSVKLRHLDEWNACRRAQAAEYRVRLAACPGITLPPEDAAGCSVYHLFVIRSSRRDALRAHLADAGVETGIHYPVALPDLRAYAHKRPSPGRYRASDLANEVLSLPVGDHLSLEDIRLVAAHVRGFFGRPGTELR